MMKLAAHVDFSFFFVHLNNFETEDSIILKGEKKSFVLSFPLSFCPLQRLESDLGHDIFHRPSPTIYFRIRPQLEFRP